MKKNIMYHITLFDLFPNTIRTFKSSLLFMVLTLGFNSFSSAQVAQFSKPAWRFGLEGGANFNFYRGSTQKLNSDFTSPVAFHKGNSVGVFIAPLVEYSNPLTGLGFNLAAGFDGKNGKFSQVLTPCNCPADLSSKLTYFTIEPSVRYAPFQSNFYLFGGPRFAFNLSKDFVYKLGINPAYPDQEPTPDVKGELSDVKNTLVSMQVGAGYDIPLNNNSHRTQFFLSPYVSYHPYFGQSPRTTETWNINTLRVGLAFKFGMGKKLQIAEIENLEMASIGFKVNAPKNIPIVRKVKEIFPLRNYIFFDLGSTEIPNRYELINKSQVKDFKEDQLDLFVPINMSGRSKRQMIVYYNLLNILGDRMIKNPTLKINLVGSSESGIADGKEMSESVKKYLVNIFGVGSDRIETNGQLKPNIPSEKPGATLELGLLREGDRRVSIETTNDAELLKEFQSKTGELLKSVEITEFQEAPLDSYVTFTVAGAEELLKEWNLEITDKQGYVQKFGPFKEEQIRISGKSILGTHPDGEYNVKMVGKANSGATVIRNSKVNMVLWTPAKTQEGNRFSILYEFNDSKAISIYEKYIDNVVVPKIPYGGRVYIHGYTDIIGDEEYNKKLSLARANDVKAIIESNLLKLGRKDVIIEVFGFGEDESVSPFNNKYPEDRFYNRTVLIDIIPQD